MNEKINEASGNSPAGNEMRKQIDLTNEKLKGKISNQFDSLVEGKCYKVIKKNGDILEFKFISSTPFTGIIKGETKHIDFDLLTDFPLTFSEIQC